MPTPRSRCAAAAALLGLLGGIACPALEPGDPVSRIKEELGEPSGFMEVSGHQTYLYERGRVQAVDGKVTAVDLVSEEALAARKQAEAEERARQAEILRLQREQRIAEGTGVMAARLDDPAFVAAPASTRLAFYQDFRSRYPEVPLPADYTAALQEVQAEQRAREAEARAREAEQRAADAERRAAEAARAEQESAARSSWTDRDVIYGYPSVIVSPVGCTCRRGHKDKCPVHSPRSYDAKYVPYHSTPGYGYQRPLTSGSSSWERPFGSSGNRGPVPRTRPQVTNPRTRPQTRP